MTISAGARLGRYEIRSKVGTGVMGDVYPAEPEWDSIERCDG